MEQKEETYIWKAWWNYRRTPVFQTIKLSFTWENVPSDMCARRRLKSACASAQSDQCIRCPHGEILTKCALRRFWSDCANRGAVWSKSSLGGHLSDVFQYFLTSFNISGNSIYFIIRTTSRWSFHVHDRVMPVWLNINYIFRTTFDFRMLQGNLE